MAERRYGMRGKRVSTRVICKACDVGASTTGEPWPFSLRSEFQMANLRISHDPHLQFKFAICNPGGQGVGEPGRAHRSRLASIRSADASVSPSPDAAD